MTNHFQNLLRGVKFKHLCASVAIIIFFQTPIRTLSEINMRKKHVRYTKNQLCMNKMIENNNQKIEQIEIKLQSEKDQHLFSIRKTDIAIQKQKLARKQLANLLNR